MGSNDYRAPIPRNPLRYLTQRGKAPNKQPEAERELPWVDLGEAFSRQKPKTAENDLVLKENI